MTHLSALANACLPACMQDGHGCSGAPIKWDIFSKEYADEQINTGRYVARTIWPSVVRTTFKWHIVMWRYIEEELRAEPSSTSTDATRLNSTVKLSWVELSRVGRPELWFRPTEKKEGMSSNCSTNKSANDESWNKPDVVYKKHASYSCSFY